MKLAVSIPSRAAPVTGYTRRLSGSTAKIMAPANGSYRHLRQHIPDLGRDRPMLQPESRSRQIDLDHDRGLVEVGPAATQEQNCG